MNIYSIADAITCIVESWIMFMLLETFCSRNDKIPHSIYGLGVGVLALLIHLSNHVFNFGILNAVGMSCAIFAVSMLYYGRLSVKIVISVLGFLFLGVIEIMVLFTVTVVYDITVFEAVNNPSYRLLGIIISKAVTYLIISAVRAKLKRREFNMGPTHWGLFLIIFMNAIVAVFLIFKLSYDTKITYMYNLSVICSFGLLICTFISLYLYETHAKQVVELTTNNQRLQNMDLEIKHLNEIVKARNDYDSFRHDTSNRYITISGYFERGDCDGGYDYIQKIQSILKSEKNIDTGNTAFDAIVSAKMAAAKEKGIEFSTKIKIPENLPMDNDDICIIFGNALDNAIEACDRMTDVNKEISFAVIYDDKSIICKIVNTSPEVNDISKSSKIDKENHGFGIGNIRKTLEKYNSQLFTNFDNGKFTLKFIILL